MPITDVKIPIKDWALDDRPREKLSAKGRQVLSDAELIAILIGSGNRSESAVQLSQRILAAHGNDLNQLGRMTVSDLTKFRGIGEAKAISIIAAMELGRRRKEVVISHKTKISSSKDAFLLFKSKLEDLPHEEFWLLLLNRSNTPLETQLVSRGGVTGTVADIKIILKMAIDKLASGIIVAHNHPSGNLDPSKADISLTKKIKDAGALIDLPLLDHIIVSDHGYYSFADNGIL